MRLRAVGPFERDSYQTDIMALTNRLGVSGAIDWTGFTQDVNAEFKNDGYFCITQSVWRGYAYGDS